MIKLTQEMIDYLGQDLGNRLYYDPSTDSIVRGSTFHGDYEAMLLSPDDVAQADGDLEVLVGVLLCRYDRIFNPDDEEGEGCTYEEA